MDGATFDTYQRITELKNTCFKEEQAEIVVNAIKKSGYVSIVCCYIINHRYYSTMEHKYERIKV